MLGHQHTTVASAQYISPMAAFHSSLPSSPLSPPQPPGLIGQKHVAQGEHKDHLGFSGLCSVPGLYSKTMTKASNMSGFIYFVKSLGCSTAGRTAQYQFLQEYIGQTRDRTQHPPRLLCQHKWFQHPPRENEGKADTMASPCQDLERSLKQANARVSFLHHYGRSHCTFSWNQRIPLCSLLHPADHVHAATQVCFCWRMGRQSYRRVKSSDISSIIRLFVSPLSYCKS